MSDLQTFGPIVTNADVAGAVISTLQEWIATYLDRMCRYIGQPPGWLQPPNSYQEADDIEHFPEDQQPAIVVVVPGTIGEPKRQGDRSYRANFDVRVACWVEANDRRSTKKLADYYGAAIRECLLQKANLGGLAAGTTWRGSPGVRFSDRVQRSLGADQVNFSVDVRDVVRSLGGPATVPVDPTTAPADWPTVQRTTPVIISPE